MFKRDIVDYLAQWSQKTSRKPLVLRGARQVGKTIAIRMFSLQFKNFIELNLDDPKDLAIFQNTHGVDELIDAIQIKSGKTIKPIETLLFIDEIQNSIEAIQSLRFFYEKYPQLHVIAAGSLLEVKLSQKGFSFPVGRVEYAYMYPVTFNEYLAAAGDSESLTYIDKLSTQSKVPEASHKILLERFYKYLLLGGMPEALKVYFESNSIVEMNTIQEGILATFQDDIHKYTDINQSKYLIHAFYHAPYFVGQRYTYEHFAGSSYKSREMSYAFDLLEKALLFHQCLPTNETILPLIPNLKQQKKLIFLDIGLVNHKLNLQNELLNVNELSNLYRGAIAEQIVGQTLLSVAPFNQQTTLYFWDRNKAGSSAEIDFIYQHEQRLIPIEVKSGKTGRLRSLHQFMQVSGEKLAIRVYSGELRMETIEIAGNKTYQLLSIPFYLTHRIPELLLGLILTN